MRRREAIFILVVVAAVLGIAGNATAQKYPERGNIRSGNRAYERARYPESAEIYRRALEKNPESFEAAYNLGNATYRQGEWEGAEALFSRLTKADGAGEQERFNAHFNNGNALFQQRKLEEALEEYKEALRIDPGDMEAKFNLAYVKKMLEKDDDDNDDQDQEGDGGGGGGGDDQDPDRDNNEGDGNGDGEPQPDDGGNDGENDNGNDPPDPREGQGQQPPGMSREEAEALLEAIQMNEDRTREKMEEKRAAAAQSSGKNW